MARNIKARRKLADLYATGTEVRFGPEGGRVIDKDDTSKPTSSEVVVWVQPPSPLQRDQAMRDANAARAKSLLRINRKDENSEEWIVSQAFVSEMSDDTLVEYLLEVSSDTRQNEAIRDILARDEWKEMGALQDAMRQYDSGEVEPDEDDPEYQALMEADKRYGAQIRDRYEELVDADRESLRILDRSAWEKRAIDRRAELIGSQVFITEYERQMTYYSVRDFDDRNSLFFESAREWAEQDDKIHRAVSDALATFIQDSVEAKSLGKAEAGSAQSDQPAEPETSDSSTPEESTD